MRFAFPALLWGLLALPILWLLLRAIPPAPIRRRFPGVAPSPFSGRPIRKSGRAAAVGIQPAHGRSRSQNFSGKPSASITLE